MKFVRNSVLCAALSLVMIITGTAWGANYPDLFAAAASGSANDVKYLIWHGADINATSDGWTPLMYAAMYNSSWQVIEALVNEGADVNKHDPKGLTPLMVAAMFNTAPMVIHTLVAYGANPNERDADSLPVLVNAVIQNSSEEVIKALIARGADVNLADNEFRMTPLMAAAMFNPSATIIKILLSNGANIKAKNAVGETALDVAKRNPNAPAIIKALKEGPGNMKPVQRVEHRVVRREVVMSSGTPPLSDTMSKTGNKSGTSGTSSKIVPLKNIPGLDKIKKKCTNAEIQDAYNAALKIVSPLTGKSQQEQIRSIASQLRRIFDSGMEYSMSNKHYNDPYGYLILRTASCAGCTRTTILCLKMLGFKSVEHVHENKYCHQWARVKMNDGSYWICDAFGLYAGPEPAPYIHPTLQ